MDSLGASADTAPNASPDSGPALVAFGELLASLRSTRGYSLRKLAALAYCSHQRIAELERGDGRPTPELAASLDRALEAKGILKAAAEGSGDEVRRRTLIRNVGLVGLAAAGSASDAVRRGLVEVLGRDGVTDADGWEEVVAEYGLSYGTTDPHRLLDALTADLAMVHDLIGRGREDVPGSLYRVAGRLAAFAAKAWAGTGDARRARDWWRTARQAADRSGCVQTRMWVRGSEVINGLYEHRSVPVILGRAAEAVAVGGTTVSAGTAFMYAGLAQTLAVAGRKIDALSALRRVDDIAERLPRDVVADECSILCWPEVRLRHTEAYVYTALGDTAAAYEAQDRALALYPVHFVRGRAQMLLHRATCMVRDGDIVGGLGYATDVLDGLPSEHRIEHVHAIGRQTLAALPAAGQGRAEATELAARLATAG